jgi:hypothetical protein
VEQFILNLFRDSCSSILPSLCISVLLRPYVRLIRSDDSIFEILGSNSKD